MALVLATAAAVLMLRGESGGDPVGADVAKSDEEVAVYDFELFPVWVGGRCGYVDLRTGENRIAPQFNKAGFFTAAGVARVEVGGRWGLIDRTGRMVVNPRFESLLELGGPGLFAARVGDRTGVIDRTGRMIVNPQYQIIRRYDAEGLAGVTVDGRTGFIDTAGRIVVPLQPFAFPERWDPEDLPWATPRYFREGLMIAGASEGGLGYVDRSGRWAINPQFAEAQPFDSSGLAAAAPLSAGDGRVWGPGNSMAAAPPSVGEARAPRRHGYIDRSGRFVIAPRFDAALPFNGAPLAPVRLGDRWGFVDRSGAIRINPRFLRAGSFRNESGDWLALVVTDSGAGFIGTDGAFRVPAQIRGEATPFDRNGRSIVTLGTGVGAFGLIDTRGRYVVNPNFGRILPLPGRSDYLYVRFPPGWNNFAPRQGNIEFGLVDKDGRILSSFVGDSCG